MSCLQTNFHFLHEWPDIYQECLKAENNVHSEPRFAVILSRSALEKIVQWMYENDGGLESPYDTSLSSLIHEYSFKSKINERLFKEINLIRKIGNDGAHGKKISVISSLISIKYLHSFAAFLAKYYGSEAYTIDVFDETLLSNQAEASRTVQPDESQQLKVELAALKAQLEEQERSFRIEQHALEQKIKFSEEERLKYKAAQRPITERREQRQKSLELNKVVPHNVPESVTRKVYIDVFLKEAGWDTLLEGRELEYEVSGMPKNLNPSGVGYVDYVLWGDDGLPLAVIEAKKAMLSAEKGRHQASL